MKHLTWFLVLVLLSLSISQKGGECDFAAFIVRRGTNSTPVCELDGTSETFFVDIKWVVKELPDYYDYDIVLDYGIGDMPFPYKIPKN